MMVEIVELVRYRTSDGIEFEEESEAMEHELQLAMRSIEPYDLEVQNHFGESLALNEIWYNIGSAYYAKVTSEEALNFFNDASKAEGLEGLPHVGVFRYDEIADKWVSPQDDIEKIAEVWQVFDENINFTVT